VCIWEGLNAARKKKGSTTRILFGGIHTITHSQNHTTTPSPGCREQRRENRSSKQTVRGVRVYDTCLIYYITFIDCPQGLVSEILTKKKRTKTKGKKKQSGND
jgi:hypothetical protein